MLNLEHVVDLIALAGFTFLMDTDNCLAIAVVAKRAPAHSRTLARALGLGLSLVLRIVLLLLIVHLMRIDNLSIMITGRTITLREGLLLAAGLFLFGKSVHEILNGAGTSDRAPTAGAALKSFRFVALQIAFVDLTLSVDSIVTVVGMAASVAVMVAVIVIDVVLLFFSSSVVLRIAGKHPSFDTLIVCALLLIGVALISSGLGRPIDKHYIYAMMAFAFFVEIVSLRKERVAGSLRT